MKHLRWAVVLSFTLLSACSAVSEATRGVTSAAGNLVMSNADEKKLGQDLATEVKQKEKVLDNAAVQTYVNNVARKVLAAVPSKKKPFSYTFTVLDSNQVNAFALPGGQVFVYTGLLKAVANESELAGVLGHEIAHVTEGHARDSIAAQYGMGVITQILLGKNQGALVQMGTQIAQQGYLAAYSRDSENEADSVGLGYMAKAGFAPAAMASFFNTLQKLGGSQGGAVDAFFASHPGSADRAKTITKLIAERKLGPGNVAPVGGLEAVKSQLK